MKKMKVLGIAALALLMACVFIGCGGDSNEPEEMVFANDDKEFTIRDNLSFNVYFKKKAEFSVQTGEDETFDFGVPAQKNVFGTIDSENKWDDATVTGTVKTIDSDDPSVKSGVPMALGTQIKLTYTKESDEITKVKVEFPLPAHFVDFPSQEDLGTMFQTMQSSPTDQTNMAKVTALVTKLTQGGYLTATQASGLMTDPNAAQTIRTAVEDAFADMMVYQMCATVIAGDYNKK